jgi:hypothetical protein
LTDFIKEEFTKQAKLNERALPSIGTIALLHSYRKIISVTLSDSGDVMVCGSSDSSIKVFWLNSEKVKDMLGLTDNPNSQLSSDGLKVRLYSELLQSKG